MCACVHVFMCVTLWHFLQWVFNGCVAMATPCLHAQSNGSFVRPLRKQAIRRHLHTHTHAHALKSTRTKVYRYSLKTVSVLPITQELNDYAFSYYNCITLKHLYINGISVDYSYNSSKLSLCFCIFSISRSMPESCQKIKSIARVKVQPNGFVNHTRSLRRSNYAHVVILSALCSFFFFR